MTPKRGRNYVLLLFGFVFHAWGGTGFTVLLIASIVVNFLVAKQLGKKRPSAKKWLTAGILFNVVLLLSFKYVAFFVENLNGMMLFFNQNASPFGGIKILLPLGISFFTFQQMSMLWDIYRKEETQKITFSNTALYVSFFPQLIAGPIVRYNDIIDEIKSRKETFDLFYSGIQRFMLGVFKKVVIANGCGLIIDTILKENISQLDSSAAWFGIIAYAFQIFFDFSGYSDMAIGLGRMFGFRILENFNFPYIAGSIQDFWRRWHISLSSWFKDYVYIPLGGNKLGNTRTYFNLFVVFLLTGFWHGATWSFVFWGLFHGFFIIIERGFLGKILKKLPGIVGWIYTILVVLIGWVYFRVSDFSEATTYVSRMFDFRSNLNLNVYSFVKTDHLFTFSFAIILSIPWKLIVNRLFKTDIASNQIVVSLRTLLLFTGFLFSVMALMTESYNPFIYFNF